ncbi:chromate efflux transporter [Macrococcus equipercicus]|uniref:Chromate efflux transporter n=1 Tax=Macrococcus equipercicus TaxID=69967 RepID=A0A9Q9BRA6_9STAP|nr:chromate efflux transporter [Macrococcus equipercicus]UTH14134.1 chromate efflux transporter [Macrococcus equipercicus]
MNRLIEIFMVALKLGLTSFGGPTAHLGYFRNEYVERRQWLSDKMYQDLVALCQFLPGPASSQVGMAIGMMRGGIIGGILAFLGFTLPSVLLLIAAVYLIHTFSVSLDWIQGLKLVAVAVVLHALLGMGRTSMTSIAAVIIAAAALFVSLLLPTAFTQIGIIIISGVSGIILFKAAGDEQSDRFLVPVSKRTGIVSLIVLLTILLVLPLVTSLVDNDWLHMFDKFYRSGLLVFGGGHVVLPLLEREFVPGMMTADDFIAGYGFAQAVPGPLFTFASYLGAVIKGLLGGLFAMFAIFLPAFLLILGCLPFWEQMRKNTVMRRALKGINAGVLGILAAAWITPIITHTITAPLDVLVAALLFIMLHYFKIAPWLIVVTGIIIGLIVYR